MKSTLISSKSFFSLGALNQKKFNGSTFTSVTSNEVPGFVNISFSLLKLNKGGFQVPIWHTNAHKIGYCQQGAAQISLRSPEKADTFNVGEGDMFFIPQGSVHHIINKGDKECALACAFNHTKPETMQFSRAIQSISDEVFTATFNTGSAFPQGLKKSKEFDLIKTLPNLKFSGTDQGHYKFNIASSEKTVSTKGGYLQIGTKSNLPLLDGLGILRFGLNAKGCVEPHWHTNAGELVYIVKGQTRITILAPDGNVDVLEVNGGEGAFAPASHFHNIQNVGSEEVEVIAFFSHAEPDYIGIGEVVGSLNNDVLGSVFNVSPQYFDQFKKPTSPLVIVPV